MEFNLKCKYQLGCPKSSGMKFNSIIFYLITFGLGLLLNENVLAQKKESLQIDFSFGIVSDCQYSDVVGTAERKYSISNVKLEECVSHFNTMELEYVIHLGDFIDGKFKNFDVVNPIYNQLDAPKFHVLGNHDFAVKDEKKKDVPQKMGLPSRYYDFRIKGWRFIVLDGNDISFHAYPKDSDKFMEASKYYAEHKINSPKWNGAIGLTQLIWLKGVLEKASRNKEKVILYCHFPVFPENIHNLWNASEITSLIEDYPNVKAYINGHNHGGNYGVEKGVHYLTIKGMVDTNQSSYAVVQVYKDHLKIVGYGREDTRVLYFSE